MNPPSPSPLAGGCTCSPPCHCCQHEHNDHPHDAAPLCCCCLPEQEHRHQRPRPMQCHCCRCDHLQGDWQICVCRGPTPVVTPLWMPRHTGMLVAPSFIPTPPFPLPVPPSPQLPVALWRLAALSQLAPLPSWQSCTSLHCQFSHPHFCWRVGMRTDSAATAWWSALAGTTLCSVMARVWEYLGSFSVAGFKLWGAREQSRGLNTTFPEFEHTSQNGWAEPWPTSKIYQKQSQSTKPTLYNNQTPKDIKEDKRKKNNNNMKIHLKDSNFKD